MATGVQGALAGHKGEIFALHIAMNLLFSGGRDSTLRVWAFDMSAQAFVLQAEIGHAQGGHTHAIMCMTSVGNFLYSGDWGGCIKVWDLVGGSCTQTITGAHNHIVSQLMPWQDPEGRDFILSSSFDGSVRVWAHEESPAPAAVLKPTPVYTLPDDQQPHSSASHNKANRLCQVLDMMGQLDTNGEPVLITSHSEEQQARLWALPTFDERGVLPRVSDARAICSGPGGLMFTGDSKGLIRVFQFKAP
mmetsp:Transcript_10057/g.28852  ORF Transcript_10057/g.28852 Transcript_10057/m.28852 type:complete len:247 (-) Transcript_10057:297-1037(-)